MIVLNFEYTAYSIHSGVPHNAIIRVMDTAKLLGMGES